MVTEAELTTLRRILLLLFRLLAGLSWGLLFIGAIVAVIVSLCAHWQSELGWMKVRDGFMLLTAIMLLPAFFAGLILGFITHKRMERYIFWGLCVLIFAGLFGHWLYWALR